MFIIYDITLVKFTRERNIEINFKINKCTAVNE